MTAHERNLVDAGIQLILSGLQDAEVGALIPGIGRIERGAAHLRTVLCRHVRRRIEEAQTLDHLRALRRDLEAVDLRSRADLQEAYQVRWAELEDRLPPPAAA